MDGCNKAHFIEIDGSVVLRVFEDGAVWTKRGTLATGEELDYLAERIGSLEDRLDELDRKK